MWTRDFASKLGRMVVRGLVRWLEMLGENPPLSRDHAFLVWQALHERGQAGDRENGGKRPAGEPGRAIGPAPLGWVPPLGVLEPPSQRPTI